MVEVDRGRIINNVNLAFYSINNIPLVSLDTCLPGCFYNSVYNCIDKGYSETNNRHEYICKEKEKLIEVLRNNIDTLADGMYREIKDEECSLDRLINDIRSGANVGYELLPLMEYYFNVNIYILDITNLKKINTCSIEREDRNCIVLGFYAQHFTSIALLEDGKYVTNFSYNSNFMYALRNL